MIQGVDFLLLFFLSSEKDFSILPIIDFVGGAGIFADSRSRRIYSRSENFPRLAAVGQVGAFSLVWRCGILVVVGQRKATVAIGNSSILYNCFFQWNTLWRLHRVVSKFEFCSPRRQYI